MNNPLGKRVLEWHDIGTRAMRVASILINDFAPKTGDTSASLRMVKLYPIPRGGIFAAQAVVTEFYRFGIQTVPHIVSHPQQADVFIDDIIDSGATRKRYVEKYNKPFYALVDKLGGDGFDWYVFPWEEMSQELGPEDNIRRILQYIGEDTEREGLRETPQRVVKSYAELFSGYKIDPESVFKTFESENYDEMVLLKNVEFYSMCEHHMLPFVGKAHIAYIPHKKVLGISKLARVLEIYSRRLQIQERLCQQITSALDEHLQPTGSACVLEAQHFCMQCRGVNKQNSMMVTSSLTGAFREPAVRQEFLNLIRG